MDLPNMRAPLGFLNGTRDDRDSTTRMET